MSTARSGSPSAPRAGRLVSIALVAASIAPVAGVLTASLCASDAARADGAVADKALPWNPVRAAAPGDWAFYQVRDPDRPEERLPGERYLVQAVDGGFASLIDSKGDVARYPLGEAGTSAKAWLEGFFGEARKSMVADLTSLEVTADGCDIGGKRYEGARIDISLAVRTAPDAPPTPATFRLWVSGSIHGSGLVRADAAVTIGAVTHRGVLELEAHGTKDDRMPSRNPNAQPAPQAATPTAAPAATTGTAAPK